MFRTQYEKARTSAGGQLGILWARLNGRKKRARPGANFHGRSGTELLHAKNQPTNIKFRLYPKKPAPSGSGLARSVASTARD